MNIKTAAQSTRLTPRQLQSLKAIRSFQTSRGYSPTMGELASELRISRSTAFEHIVELRRKELLSASPGRARSLKLTSKAQRLLDGLIDQSPAAYPQTSTNIPIAGRVTAGLPLEAIEDRDYLSIETYFGKNDDVFALEVTGDSMVGDDIRDGDYVICRRSKTAHNGQLVVAITDENDATLKRFYKEKNHARLQPANDDYKPIYSDNCRIEAVVVGLIRKL